MSDSQADNLPQQTTLVPPRFQSIRAILALILREMASTYGASPGGYIWAILQPVGTLALLSIAFSLLVRAPALGTSFILFYATGYLPFDIYNTVNVKIEGALKYARALLAYPRMTWVDAVLSRFILHMLTLTTVFCIVTCSIILIQGLHVSISVLPILLGLLAAGLLGMGVGMINAVLIGLFPVWKTIWAILSRPLFLASGIFYTFEGMPRSVQDLLWYNPLIHVAGLVRQGFYITYHPEYVSVVYLYGLSLILILFGLVFMKGNYSKVLEN